MTISKKARAELAIKLLSVDFLKEREKDILKLRLGLENQEPSTLQEIGEKYGITRERVRQIGASIVRKTKKFLPEEKSIVNKLFTKAWEPKYVVKEKRVKRRRATIKRNRTIIRNNSKKLAEYIEEFSRTREGKDRINQLFKELRIKYRKNKSLFEPDVVIEIKNLRLRYALVKKGKPILKDRAKLEKPVIKQEQTPAADFPPPPSPPPFSPTEESGN